MDIFKSREDISKENPRYKIPRGDKEWVTIDEPKHQQTSYNSNVTTEMVEKWRSDIITDFPNVIIDVMTYDGLDQGQDGACAIASTYNLLNLLGKNSYHGRSGRYNTWKSLKAGNGKTGWRAFYKKVLKWNNDGIHDMQDMLRYGIKDKQKFVLNMLNDPNFKYVPIKSDGREVYVNKDIVSDSKNIVKSIRLFIEGLIDRKIPVNLSWQGHARIAVGYNETEILFADSWTTNYEQTSTSTTRYNGNNIKDWYRGGFSSTNKFAVYSFVRDCFYFEPETTDELDVNMSLSNLKF